ncbi:hypothetical protein Cgig2_012233 [Carnegiea gigantea]|uniref:F-box domain-containing protein n=1 Tax=Carnegiea gigantea TaxID=171969 RepID=A0A9Q1QNQ9_9CARY|nr:hypothetical protein Cgig2_012233 [Carnegiea gigantea]
MMKILARLDAHSLARSLLVSHPWFSLASSDALWSPLEGGKEPSVTSLIGWDMRFRVDEGVDKDRKVLEGGNEGAKDVGQHSMDNAAKGRIFSQLPAAIMLWTGKAHIPRLAKVSGLSQLARHSRAVIDSKRSASQGRIYVTLPGASISLRLPHHIGKILTHTGEVQAVLCAAISTLMESTLQTQRTRIWGGHECSCTIVTGIVGDGKVRENYVRVNRWPRLAVLRREDWGWEMSNVVCAYSSIPDADIEGGTGPIF